MAIPLHGLTEALENVEDLYGSTDSTDSEQGQQPSKKHVETSSPRSGAEALKHAMQQMIKSMSLKLTAWTAKSHLNKQQVAAALVILTSFELEARIAEHDIKQAIAILLRPKHEGPSLLEQLEEQQQKKESDQAMADLIARMRSSNGSTLAAVLTLAIVREFRRETGMALSALQKMLHGGHIPTAQVFRSAEWRALSDLRDHANRAFEGGLADVLSSEQEQQLSDFDQMFAQASRQQDVNMAIRRGMFARPQPGANTGSSEAEKAQQDSAALPRAFSIPDPTQTPKLEKQ